MVVENLETIALGLVVALLFARLMSHRRQAAWERDRRLELEAYCMLEVTFPLNGDPRKRTERAKQVARLVTERSIFARCALFLPVNKEQLVCAGSCGMDDLLLDSVDGWCTRYLREQISSTPYRKERQMEDARKSFPVSLRRATPRDEMFAQDCENAILVPVRLERGKLVGLLAVCGSRTGRLNTARYREAMAPLELLAAKLARTMERSMLMDRLIQVERLAGAAHLTAGVAEAMTDPLRAIQDRSELIAGTTIEARIREHAQAIAIETGQIGATLETLRDAWRPREEAPHRVTDGHA